jgi:uncharacterized protein YycO
MRGDLIFYTPRDLWDRLICWGTHGPFSHVAIDLGDGTVIEATPQGIRRNPVSYTKSVQYPVYPTTNLPLIEKGIAWLNQQVGKEYGWTSIFDQVLRFFGDQSVYVYDHDDYDCSDLATRYLLLASPKLVGRLSQNPSIVSPNDLARQLGLPA